MSINTIIIVFIFIICQDDLLYKTDTSKNINAILLILVFSDFQLTAFFCYGSSFQEDEKVCLFHRSLYLLILKSNPLLLSFSVLHLAQVKSKRW